MKCSKYDVECNEIRSRIYELGRRWSLEGILGVSEKNEIICCIYFVCLFVHFGRGITIIINHLLAECNMKYMKP